MDKENALGAIAFLLAFALLVGSVVGIIWWSHSTSRETCEEAFGQGTEWESSAQVDGENVELCQLSNGTVRITDAEPIEVPL